MWRICQIIATLRMESEPFTVNCYSEGKKKTKKTKSSLYGQDNYGGSAKHKMTTQTTNLCNCGEQKRITLLTYIALFYVLLCDM